MAPQGEILFVNRRAFWLEPFWNPAPTTTLQAFREGAFEGAWCLDASGTRWPIVAAQLSGAPSLLHRLFPRRRLSVQRSLGQPEPAQHAAVADALCQVLQEPESEFPYYALNISPDAMQLQLRRVSSLSALIDLVKAHSRRVD